MSKKNSQDKSKNQWWNPIKDSLDGVNLKGIKLKCPKCGNLGYVTTRWIKGPALKPIFILHFKNGEVGKICELDQDQSNCIRGNVPVLESDINSLLKNKKPYALFSGGKDSLATLIYLNQKANKLNKDLTAIYVDTTVGLPENTKYVKSVCKYLGINLTVVKPKKDYFTLVKEWGIPSFKYRWCCRELKIKPIEDYLKKVEEPKVVFDGIRASESYLRRQYIPIWYHPSFKCLSVSPIFHWSDQQVVSLINHNGIPKSLLNSLNTSQECWCGAYKTEADFKKLYEINRKMFKKLSKVESENKSGYTFLYKNGKRISLKELEKQITKK